VHEASRLEKKDHLKKFIHLVTIKANNLWLFNNRNDTVPLDVGR